MTGVPARTCARIVARRGLPRLADVDRVTGEARRRGPVTPVRYERERPGELLHVDVKKVARIPDGGGWRARGASELDHGRGSGGRRVACLHVAVDDFSRVAYAELLPDERRGTCSAFMARCLAFFAGLGVAVERVMTDNGPGYRSRELNALLAAEGVRHIYTRPYSPWQNGKVERMNRALAQEWQYGRAWDGEAERTDALPAYLEHYNWSRPHSACGGPAAPDAHRRRKQPIGTQQLVAIVTCLYFYSEMRTAREATQANGFMRRETFDLTDKADVFTSTSVTRRRIERTDK